MSGEPSGERLGLGRGREAHPDEVAAGLAAALDAAALADRSALARFRAGGPDLLDLLDRLGTKAVARLPVGSGAMTVLTTPKGRIVDRLWVHRAAEDEVLLVGSAGSAERVAAHLARYTFAEQTGLENVSASTVLLALCGPRAREAAAAAGLEPPPPLGVVAARLAGETLWLLGEDGLAGDGLGLLARREAEPALREVLTAAVGKVGGRPAGPLALEVARVLRGLPAGGHELTEAWNPLEAGLWDAVDFDKGCYVGQEVVARLRTYDKVSRTLVGLELGEEGGALPEPGAPLFAGGRNVGELTSVVRPPGRAPIGLAYLKRKALDEPGAPEALAVGAAESRVGARVVELPFPRS